MTQAPARFDVAAEVAAITMALAAQRDPSYEWGMRRTVPPAQPARATRVPDIRKTASEWRREHHGLPVADTLALADALWATGWREERLVAIDMLRSRASLAVAGWLRLERWSAQIDNWELVDHLADVSGRVLNADPSLVARVEALSASENAWQRRFALVTLIVGFMKSGLWHRELASIAERLRRDPHPLVRRAAVWARDRLAKDHLDG